MFFSSLNRNQPKDASYQYWPLIEEQVREFLEAWPEQFEEDAATIEGWMKGPLLEAAVHPEAFADDRKLKDACARIYARHPEFYLASLLRLRQVDSGKFGIESQVQRWLMLNPTVNIMNQDFPVARLDNSTLAKLFKRDTGVDVKGDVLKGLVQQHQPPAA
jgi:hypothetical protein